MSLALYRKYRPQTWAQVTGQNHVKVTLQNEIEAGKIAHAYLFTGPRGIGKTTTARLFAKSINCQNRKEGQSEPCNKCDSCLELVAGNDMDILEVDAASHTGVDNVRENIIANARFTPVKRKYKVFIIDEVHMLSISAFNALLKILEEPPQHAIFILATTEVHKVPATIISRCQRFDFKKVNFDDLIKRLTWISQQENIKVANEVLVDIAHVSEGSLRDAESLLGQILSLGGKEISREEASLIIPSSNYASVLELVDNLVYKNIEGGITLVNKVFEDGVDLVKFNDELVEFLRKIILSKISGGLKEFAFDLDDKTEKSIIDLAQKFSLDDLLRLINLFSSKKFEIKTASIPQLPLEVAIIEYCSQGSSFTKAPDDKGVGKGGGGCSVISETKVKDTKSGATSTTLKNEISAKQPKNLKPLAITLDEIKSKWHRFLVKLQDSNASMVFILKVAEPIELKGNSLYLGLKYAFHKQRVDQAKIKEAIEKVLQEFFNEDIIIETTLLANNYDSEFLQQQTKDDEVELIDEIPSEKIGPDQQQLIDTLVKTFGGKIVE